jgi:hypothetical protein
MELSQQAFYEAWKYLNLGTMPLVLNVLPAGLMEAERREIENQAWDELRRHGFGDRDDDDDYYGAFLPLQRYEHAFDITYRSRAGGQERNWSGMVARGHSHATFAVRGDQTVRIFTLRTDDMIRALLSVLPVITPGPGRGVSVRSSALDAAAEEAGESNRAMIEGLNRQGIRRDDALALVDMASGKRTEFAQFGATVMDRNGHRVRAPMVTNIFATPRGWYLLEENHHGSEPWTTVAPIDQHRIATRIQDLLKTITAQ